MEFEWLRPWAAQGGAHAASHALYWRPRMARLLRAWERLEARTAAHVAALVAAAEVEAARGAELVPDGVRCFDWLEQALIKRQGAPQQGRPDWHARSGWEARLRSSAYTSLPDEHLPLPMLRFRPGTAASVQEPELGPSVALLPEDLADTMRTLRAARATFQQKQAHAQLGQVPGPGTGAAAAPPVGGGGKKRKRKGGMKDAMNA